MMAYVLIAVLGISLGVIVRHNQLCIKDLALRLDKQQELTREARRVAERALRWATGKQNLTDITLAQMPEEEFISPKVLPR